MLFFLQDIIGNHFLIFSIVFTILLIIILFMIVVNRVNKKFDLLMRDAQTKRYNEDKMRVIQEQKEKVVDIDNNLAIGGDFERIVDIQIKGPWTKYVLMRKIDYLKSIKYLFDNKESIEEEKGNKLGYWQLITMASGRSYGKNKSRGR